MSLFNRKPVPEAMAPRAGDTPKGRRLLAQIVRENLWELFAVSQYYLLCLLPFLLPGLFFLLSGGFLAALLCLLCSFPLSGPASLAMAKVFSNWLRSRGYEPSRTFWRTFAKEYRHGCLAGLLYQGILSVLAFSAYFYFSASSRVMIVLGFLAVALMLVVWVSSIYGYLMLADIDLPFFAIFKNSFLLFFLDLRDDLLILLAALVLCLPLLIYLPQTLLILLLSWFSWLWLLAAYWGWRALQKYVVKENAAKADADAAPEPDAKPHG